jgi:hypothetical protein
MSIRDGCMKMNHCRVPSVVSSLSTCCLSDGEGTDSVQSPQSPPWGGNIFGADSFSVTVKKTFIHATSPPNELEGFAEKRRACSAPASRQQSPSPNHISTENDPAAPDRFSSLVTFDKVEESDVQAPVWDCSQDDVHLYRMFAQPSGLPSVGSAKHEYGTCKPCAFLHTKGCASGFDCEFCHMCEAGAVKQRKKQKLDQRRDWRRQMIASPARPSVARYGTGRRGIGM